VWFMLVRSEPSCDQTEFIDTNGTCVAALYVGLENSSQGYYELRSMTGEVELPCVPCFNHDTVHKECLLWTAQGSKAESAVTAPRGHLKEPKENRVKEESFSMVLIGSATASSIFLIALLIWAVLLTAERFKQVPEYCAGPEELLSADELQYAPLYSPTGRATKQPEGPTQTLVPAQDPLIGLNSLTHEHEVHPTSIVINVTTNIKPCSQNEENITREEKQKHCTIQEMELKLLTIWEVAQGQSIEKLDYDSVQDLSLLLDSADNRNVLRKLGRSLGVPPQVNAHIQGFQDLFQYLRTSTYTLLPHLAQAAALLPNPEVVARIHRAVSEPSLFLSLVSTSPCSPTGCDVLRTPALEKNREGKLHRNGGGYYDSQRLASPNGPAEPGHPPHSLVAFTAAIITRQPEGFLPTSLSAFQRARQESVEYISIEIGHAHHTVHGVTMLYAYAAAAQAQAEERRSLADNSPGPTTNAPAKPQGNRPVIDGAALRIDDRLRVAKERREEAEKQQALRDSHIMDRERKAKMQVERQVEERQKKLDEQKRKEEQKRLAEHYEAVMRRTLERSQRVEQRQKRWSWGGLSTDSDGRTGDSDAGASSPVTIVISPASPEKPPTSRQVDKRSTSTMNLKQMSEPGISKRLSSSSATLIKSPDKRVKQRSSSCNRLPNNGNAAQASKEDGKKLQVEPTGRSLKKRSSSLTRVSAGRAQTPAKPDKGTTDNQARKAAVGTVDGGVLSRLLTPTQASLARSKSAAALSAEGTNAPASASPLNPPRGAPVRSRSIDRQKSGMTTSVSADGALDPSMKDKTSSSPGVQRPASPSSTLGRNRSPSPAPNPAPKRTPSPAPNPAPNPAPKRTPSPASKQNSKTRPPSPGAMKQRPPSPGSSAAKPPPIQKPALTPTGPPTLRKRDSKSKDMCPVLAVSPLPSESSKSKEKDDSKGSTGTNSAAEAAKILAENRRLMREQKEKEEQLRLQREEEEKVRKEEEMRLAEEARLIRLEEDKKLAEDKKMKDEEDALLAEEERAELLKEREEAEAKALEEAEKVRQERERVMQQNQQERMERKKRIEEIMKRTRKGEQSEKEEDKAECDLSSGEPAAEREAPLGSVNGKPETDDKENNNGMSTEETQAVSPVPKGRLVEGSEFLNEQDSAKVGLVSGLNGKSNQWSFEELNDLNVHSKTRPLIQAEDCKQVLISCDGSSDGTRVAFEDKGTPVNPLHSSNQPIEALSGEESRTPVGSVHSLMNSS
ncbi:Ensconsin, partial [Dissostichus eleginoides]